MTIGIVWSCKDYLYTLPAHPMAGYVCACGLFRFCRYGSGRVRVRVRVWIRVRITIKSQGYPYAPHL